MTTRRVMTVIAVLAVLGNSGRLVLALSHGRGPSTVSPCRRVADIIHRRRRCGVLERQGSRPLVAQRRTGDGEWSLFVRCWRLASARMWSALMDGRCLSLCHSSSAFTRRWRSAAGAPSFWAMHWWSPRWRCCCLEASSLRVAVEGLICLLMAAPIALPVALFGGAVGFGLRHNPVVRNPAMFLLLAGPDSVWSHR